MFTLAVGVEELVFKLTVEGVDLSTCVDRFQWVNAMCFEMLLR